MIAFDVWQVLADAKRKVPAALHTAWDLSAYHRAPAVVAELWDEWRLTDEGGAAVEAFATFVAFGVLLEPENTEGGF